VCLILMARDSWRFCELISSIVDEGVPVKQHPYKVEGGFVPIRLCWD
jgi:hypothetical protein